jgi:hypothetical protein
MNLKNLKTITSILFVTLIALSIAPATLPVAAQTYIYARSFSVVAITSSRATGTFYKNQVFYVFIDLSSLNPITANVINISIKAPSGGYYFTYPINASRLGRTLTFVVWFNITQNGELKWGSRSGTSVDATYPEDWLNLSPRVTFTEEGQYLEVIAGDKSLKLFFKAYPAELREIPSEVYIDGITPTSVGWKIYAPDLNVNPIKVNNFTVTGNNVTVYLAKVAIDGTEYSANCPINISETGKNTDTFKINDNIFEKCRVGAKPIKDLLAADKSITLTFNVAKFLRANLADVKQLWVLTTTIAVKKAPPISISVDRTTIPLSDIVNMSIKVTVTDAGRASANIPSVPVTAEVYNVSGALKASITCTLSRVEKTINYKGYCVLNTTKWNTPEYIRGWVIVKYTGSDSKLYSTDRLTLSTFPMSISISPSSVKFGDAVTLRICDQRLNNKTDVKDEITLGTLVTKGVLSISPRDALKNAGAKLVETDVNSACFEVKLTVAKDKDIYADAGSKVTFTYVNAKWSTLSTPEKFIRETKSDSFVIEKFAGKVVTSKAEYYPYETLVIRITDYDRNINVDRRDSISKSLVFIRDGGVVKELPRNLIETDRNTGIFEYSIPLSEFAAYYLGTGKTVEDLLKVRNFEVVYRDDVSPEGVTIDRFTFRVVSSDPTVLTDKTAYNIGEKIKITVVDPDQNDPTKFDYVEVRVASDTDPIGVKVTLWETDKNTGVFTGEVLLTDREIAVAGYILAKIGDKITVTYTDRWPADFYITGKAKPFSVTVGVGVFAEKPGKVEKVDMRDVVTGQPVTPKVGKEVFLRVEVSNVDIVDRSMTIIVVVRDPNGVAVARYATELTILAGKSVAQSFGWTPIVAGDHTVEVYIVKSLVDRTPLGDPATFTVSVSA